MKTDFWAKTLKEKGLESPGREEAVRKTLEYIQEKKDREELLRKEKLEKRKRK